MQRSWDWKYVGSRVHFPHDDKPFDDKTCRQAIAVFNHAGEVLAEVSPDILLSRAWLRIPTLPDGTLFDLMMKETNPQYMHFQMDVFRIVHPGQVPRKLLKI